MPNTPDEALDAQARTASGVGYSRDLKVEPIGRRKMVSLREVSARRVVVKAGRS
jgi:hypothetical protein